MNTKNNATVNDNYGFSTRNNFLNQVNEILAFYRLPILDIDEKIENLNEHVQVAFDRLVPLMYNYQNFATSSIDESFFTDKFFQWMSSIYQIKKFRYPRFFYESKLWRFPDINKLYSSIVPKSIQLLENHYKSQKENNKISNHKYYCEAVKERLFIQLLNEATEAKEELGDIDLDEMNNDDREKIEKVKDYLELLEYALYPIQEWSYRSLEDDKGDIGSKARMYLQDVGKSLNPIKVGKKKVIPFTYQIIICIVYDTIIQDFKHLKSVPSDERKKEILNSCLAGLISSESDWEFFDEPYKNAKRIVMKSLSVNEKELNRILKSTNRDSVLNKLEIYVKSLKSTKE